MSEMRVPPAVDIPPAGGEDLILTVRVTDLHKRQGRPWDCHHCPIALALMSACESAGILLDWPQAIKVYGDHATLYLLSGATYDGSLPLAARMFIHYFDHGPGADPVPFSVHLHMHMVEPWEGV